MNKYEQALVSAVKQITKSDAAKAASDARWLLGMVMNAAPQLSGQREYKLFTSLLSCNGNRILAEAAKKSAAARDAEVERLVQRLQSDFLLDEASARRICALYLTAVTGDESYIRALDSAGNKTNPAPQNAPKPKQRPQPQQRPAPSPPRCRGRRKRRPYRCLNIKTGICALCRCLWPCFTAQLFSLCWKKDRIWQLFRICRFASCMFRRRCIAISLPFHMMRLPR